MNSVYFQDDGGDVIFTCESSAIVPGVGEKVLIDQKLYRVKSRGYNCESFVNLPNQIQVFVKVVPIPMKER